MKHRYRKATVLVVPELPELEAENNDQMRRVHMMGQVWEWEWGEGTNCVICVIECTNISTQVLVTSIFRCNVIGCMMQPKKHTSRLRARRLAFGGHVQPLTLTRDTSPTLPLVLNKYQFKNCN